MTSSPEAPPDPVPPPDAAPRRRAWWGRLPGAQSWEQLAPFTPRPGLLRVALIGVTSFIGTLSESAVLVLVTLTADSLIRDESSVAVLNASIDRQDAVVLALACVLVRVVMAYLSARSIGRFSSSVLRRAQESLLAAYVAASHRARSSRPPGDLSTLAINHGRSAGDMASAYTIVAASVCALVAYGGTSLVVNPLATVAIAVIGGVLLAVMRPLRRRSLQAADDFSDQSRSLGHEVTEVEALHREVEVFDVADPVLERFSRDTAEGAQRFERLRFLHAAVPQFFQASMLGAAVLSLLLLVNTSADTDLAAIGAVVLLLIRSMSAAQQLVTAHQRVVEHRPYAAALKELITSLDRERRRRGTSRPGSLTPVTLTGVHFSYDGATDVLEGLDLTLAAGEVVGIVGPSGAGKSTLVELLLRLRPPTKGEIRCGTVAIDDIDPGQFARRVAFVPQQAVLIAGTVAENVDFFRGYPEERIVRSLAQAHLEEEIAKLPQGVHTRLSPDERTLSGGQRQRLTIARALAGDPEIIVLDEPTSALDAVSEHAIREALAELSADRLVVVVAHRYSTLKSCDRILVLRDGRVEIDATPEEVTARSEFFRTMVTEGS